MIDWKHALSTMLGVLAAILILMAGSQITGYSLYDGEELGSHRTERVADAVEQQTSEESSAAEDQAAYDECVARNPGQSQRCAAYEKPGVQTVP